MTDRILESVSNVEWLNPEHSVIQCDVQFEGENAFRVSVHSEETLQYRKDIWDAATAAGTITEYVVATVAIDDEKTAAKLFIDMKAGEARERFITVASGQEMTYQEKSEQAADFAAAAYPADTSNYPFIQAEMEATGKTKEQTADDILAQRTAWIAVGATIEKHRLGGKKQIDEAITTDDISTIVDDTVALLDAV